MLPFARLSVEISRDLHEAERLACRAVELHGTSDTFAGDLIRQDAARIAALRDNDGLAVTHGGHLLRSAIRDGRVNFLVLGVMLLCGPLVRVGDAAFAAEAAGAAAATGFFDHFAAELRAHVVGRIRASLAEDEFPRRFDAGSAGDLTTISMQLVDRLAMLEALTGQLVPGKT